MQAATGVGAGAAGEHNISRGDGGKRAWCAPTTTTTTGCGGRPLDMVKTETYSELKCER